MRVVQERRVAARKHGEHVNRRLAAERVVQVRANAAPRLIVAVGGGDSPHGRLLGAPTAAAVGSAIIHARAHVELQLEHGCAAPRDVVRR